MAVAGKRRHLDQIADLAIVAEHLRADQQANLAVGKFPDQLLHGGHGGIGGFTDAEDQFVVGIILQAVAAEGLIHLRIDAAQRLQDTDGRSDGRLRKCASLLEAMGAPETIQVKAHPADCERGRQ